MRGANSRLARNAFAGGTLHAGVRLDCVRRDYDGVDRAFTTMIVITEIVTPLEMT